MTEVNQLPEPQSVLFVVWEGKKRTVYKGKALMFPDGVAIESLDPAGKAWIDTWWTSGNLSTQEVEIRTQGSKEERRRTLFSGFMSFTYRNPRGVPDRSGKGLERFVATLRVEQPFKGTPLLRNCNELKRDGSVWYTEEWQLYSDARFMGGDVEIGPYSIFNCSGPQEPVMGSLVFRAPIHRSFMQHGNYKPRDLAKDHRDFLDFRERVVISFADEMAALLTVATGMRIVGGGTIRRFGGDFNGALGSPVYPGAPPHIHHSDRSVLPHYSHTDPANLDPAGDILLQYLGLGRHDAATFLRSAVLFQKAMLQSDYEPDLAWIWCVSAIEALAEVPGSRTLASAKFLKLLADYLPEAPAEAKRPSYRRLDWAELEPAFEQIYGYRSQFLHAGHPFPAPMTHRPDNEMGDGRYAEFPHGGMGIGGVTFPNPSPMHLHVFVYIVRGAMLNWLHRTSEATRGVSDPEVPGDDPADVSEEGQDAPEGESGADGDAAQE